MSKIPTIHHNNSHVPVLLDAVLDVLSPKQGETYLDLTAGYGGHANAVLSHVGAGSLLTLVDRDEQAIKALQELKAQGADVVNDDYLAASKNFQAEGKKFDLILMDIGVSSPHLDKPERGFSFQNDGPLDMRMDQARGQTAAELIDSLREDELVRILKEYGQEPRARVIAKAILAARPLSTTLELSQLVEKTIGRRGKIHPATRTFQALRIAVNDELRQLEKALPIVLELLNPGGRVAVISFHSLEDRIVKKFFKSEAESGYEARLKLITKKPISGATEDAFNRRARSAKLRAAIKINNT